jgi:glycosyltransferase involved in cell wall biosynthesis
MARRSAPLTPDRRLRVLALTHVFPRSEGDASAPFLLTWAHALQHAGAQVGVVAPHDAGLPPAQFVAGVGVRLVRYAPDDRERLAYRGEMHQIATTPLGPPLVASLVTSLARTLRRQVAVAAPDVVHVHWWVPGAIVLRAARLDVPAVLTVHGTDVALLESRPALIPLARWAIRAADRVEAVSTDLADRLERLTGRTADAVNPMPLDAGWLSPTEARRAGSPGTGEESPSGRTLRVLAIGRMVPEKGFADVIDAVAGLDHPAHVTIIGDGPERSRLAARALARGVELDLPGRVSPSTLRLAYREADVVVQASHREGLGLVAAEAVCAGTPIVATDSGGVRDVLGGNGLVSVGDVAGLTAALAAVAADPEAARDRAAAAAAHVCALLSPEMAARRTFAGYDALRGVTGR